MKRLLTIVLAVITLLFLSACASNSQSTVTTTTTNISTSSATSNTTTNFVINSTTTTPTPATVSLISIDVQPSLVDLLIGTTQQFTATATYSDGSTADVTSHVVWESNNTNIIISDTGVASGNTVGIARIKATLSGITSSPVILTSVDSLAMANTTPSTTIPIATSISPVITGAPATTSTPIATQINPNTGVYNNYYLGFADTPEGDLGGDGCYDDTGDFIILINNKKAVNPTYAQLVNFLQSDTTDEFPYVYTDLSTGSYYGTAASHVDLPRIQKIIDGTEQPNPPDICGDFAERLHNDAEIDGIRCAYVAIQLSSYPDPDNLGIPSNSGHALDAFQTTDDGLVYVDDTGWLATDSHPTRAVKIANPVVGQSYITTALFPEAGWDTSGDSMGTVTSVDVIWDGTWN